MIGVRLLSTLTGNMKRARDLGTFIKESSTYQTSNQTVSTFPERTMLKEHPLLATFLETQLTLGKETSSVRNCYIRTTYRYDIRHAFA